MSENGQKDIRIVILQRGWVYVGKFTRAGEHIILEQAKCLRIWGTTKGLGELALIGPTKNTILDESGQLEYHQLTEIANINAEHASWQKLFS